MNFKQLLDKYRNEALHERDKGDRFVRFMQAYLLIDLQFANRLKHFRVWNEFPGKMELDGQVTCTESSGDAYAHFRLEKIRFPKKGQTDTFIYNYRIVLKKIPAEDYEYVVNGKSVINWIMERYQIITHKDSGITNSPNDWLAEVGNQRYILDMLLSVICLSVESVWLVKGLSKVEF